MEIIFQADDVAANMKEGANSEISRANLNAMMVVTENVSNGRTYLIYYLQAYDRVEMEKFNDGDVISRKVIG